MNDTTGFLSQWVRSLVAGLTLTDEDVARLARVAQALENAEQHHAQAREAQNALGLLRTADEAVVDAACGAYHRAMHNPDPWYATDVWGSLATAMQVAADVAAAETRKGVRDRTVERLEGDVAYWRERAHRAEQREVRDGARP